MPMLVVYACDVENRTNFFGPFDHESTSQRDIERDQLFKCITLTKHEDVFEICFENCSNFICSFAVANQLKFRLHNEENENTHNFAIFLISCDNKCSCENFLRENRSRSDIINVFEKIEIKFNFDFEASLIICRMSKNIYHINDDV